MSSADDYVLAVPSMRNEGQFNMFDDTLRDFAKLNPSYDISGELLEPTSGASTPDRVVEHVIHKLMKISEKD